MKRQSQIDALYRAMKRGIKLTNRKAREICRCENLQGRIFDMKRMGIAIESEFFKSNGARLKRYWLA